MINCKAFRGDPFEATLIICSEVFALCKNAEIRLLLFSSSELTLTINACRAKNYGSFASVGHDIILKRSYWNPRLFETTIHGPQRRATRWRISVEKAKTARIRWNKRSLIEFFYHDKTKLRKKCLIFISLEFSVIFDGKWSRNLEKWDFFVNFWPFVYDCIWRCNFCSKWGSSLNLEL